MNCWRETTDMGVPPGIRRVLVPRRTLTVRLGADPADRGKNAHLRGRQQDS